jgi:hypothetical protein
MTYLINFLSWFQDWATPWLWISIATPLFLLGLLGTSPLYLPKLDSDNATLRRIVSVKLRQWSFIALAFFCLILPLLVWGAGIKIYQGGEHGFTKAFLTFLWQGYKNVWEFPLVGAALGWTISYAYNRYFLVYLSSLKRKFSMKQTGEELTDIRKEGGRFKQKDFLPSKHYKTKEFFFGLNDEGKPIYVSDEDWRLTHQRYVGPTQTGKGVEIGVQLDQAIRKNHNVFFIDSKPDKHAKAIMKKACEETGRLFIELNLNPSGRGKYSPFLGGDMRDRRTRLMYVLGLLDSGGDADFYKSRERAIIDRHLKDWDGTMEKLRFHLSDPDIKDNVQRSLNYINEWLTISTFNTTVKRSGFSIERSLLENAVVHIQGNLDDDVINKASTVLLMELVQEVKRLNSQRKSHTFVAVDEVAFLINEKIADALATVASFECNILLAYQSEGDLLNLKDKTMNAKAINTRVKTNCKISLYYMAVDFETAQMMADDSGTIQKAVTRSQRVELGRHAEETWDDARDIHRVEEALITANKAKMLPSRVGVLYQPAKIAQVCYTSWLPIDLDKYGDKSKEVPNLALEKSPQNDEPETETPKIDLGKELEEAKKANKKKESNRIVIDDF